MAVQSLAVSTVPPIAQPIVAPISAIATVIQTKSVGPFTNTTANLTFTTANIAGNSVIAVVQQAQNGGGRTYTLSDSAGNVYSRSATGRIDSIGQVDVWISSNIVAGINTVLTSSFSSTVTGSITIYEVSGLLNVGSVGDQVNVGFSVTNTTAFTTNSISNTSAVFVIAAFSTTDSPTITPDPGWTTDFTAPGFLCLSRTKIAPSDVLENATASTPVKYIGLIISYRTGTVNIPLAVDSTGKLNVLGPVTDTQLRASAIHTIVDNSTLPPGAATEATLALVKAKTDNLDVALSTRTKPSDQQHAIVDSSALPSGAATETTLNNLLKPANTLTKVATVDTITNVVHVDDNAGSLTIDNSNLDIPLSALIKSAYLAVSTVGVSGAALTATLPAVAGQFHIITLIEVVLYAANNKSGVATPLTVTTTNLPGSLSWVFPTSLQTGLTAEKRYTPTIPLKSSVANTATTIVCPATANGLWQVNVLYRTDV